MRDVDRGDGRHDDRHEDPWRIWRVTEPDPEYLRSRTRRRPPRPWRDLPVRRWWHV
jgi:hypothetical protein